MVKGGFQGLDITGVDLTAQSPTLSGAYATCAGADGKPIRVQTADGQVECSVKKVSTNYVLAGVTGDGKILSIVVGRTDGISVSETVIPSGEEPDLYIDAGVDIAAATSANPYITEYDGIVRLSKSSSSTLNSPADVNIKGGVDHTTTFTLASLPVDTPTGVRYSFFVKKGTYLACSNVSGVSGVSALFYPYKPYES